MSLALIWSIAKDFMSIIGFIVMILMLREFLPMRGIIKTWAPVLERLAPRIPLIDKIGTMWGTMMKNKQLEGTGTKQQMEVRAKIVDGFQETLPSALPVVGGAIAKSIAKLSGNDKAIMLTDTEFLGSMLKIASSAGQTIGKIQSFLSPKKDEQPQKRRGRKAKDLKAPSL